MVANPSAGCYQSHRWIIYPRYDSYDQVNNPPSAQRTVTLMHASGLPIRYRISGPAANFKAVSKVLGAAAAPDAQGSMGINVLLHGDGGTSFFDMPNQAVQKNIMGVTVLAPDPNLFWFVFA